MKHMAAQEEGASIPEEEVGIEAPEPVTRPVIRKRISTKERRYHYGDVNTLLNFLRERTMPLEYVPGRTETHITTVYLDTYEGTWSVGRARNKLRCKNYQDPDLLWFEVKRRQGIKVEKRRQSIKPGDLPKVLDGIRRGPVLQKLIGHAPLMPLVAVRYRRTAFEWPGLRLTVDRDLVFHAVLAGKPWKIGRSIGRKEGYVVEVKIDGPVPQWLRPALGGKSPQRFSKSRWSLLARRQTWEK